jgi:Predicted membrane protein
MDTFVAIFVWILFGLIVGAIARALYPGRQPMGYGSTIALGIAGSLVGGAISWAVSGAPNRPLLEGSGWILSIVGALIVVWVVTAMNQRSDVK